jgi:hypothetical protein
MKISQSLVIISICALALKSANPQVTLINPTTNNGSFETLAGVVSAAKATHWDTDPDGDVDGWTVWTELSTADNDSGTEVSGNASQAAKQGFFQDGNAAHNIVSLASAIQLGDKLTLSWDHRAGDNLTVSLVYDDFGSIVAHLPTEVTSNTPGNGKGFTYLVPSGSPLIGLTSIGVGVRSAGFYPAADNFVLIIAPFVDTDNDTLDDDWERANFMGSLAQVASGDPDVDNLDNFGEYTEGTNPNFNDSDGDTLFDGDEESGNSNDFDFTRTEPLLADSDSDGLDDFEENGSLNIQFGEEPTNPNLADTDNDGISDSYEVANNNPGSALDPNDDGTMDATQAATADRDGDTLSNLDEILAIQWR